MIDLRQLRQLIERTPEGERAAIVRRKWLVQAEAEIAAGRAALAELAAMKAGGRNPMPTFNKET